MQTKISKLACLFDLSNWKNQSSFDVLSLDNILSNGYCLKNAKVHVHWKLLHVAIPFLHDCDLQTATQKVSLWVLARFQFFLHLKKRSYFFPVKYCDASTLRHDFAYMVISFLVSLEIPVMIDILYEMIKILHEKMSNGIYLYWFHKDTLEKNNSLNIHSNE